MLDRADILPVRIGRLAAEQPQRPFLQQVEGRACSYGETHRLALTWASALRSRGVEPGDTVVSLLPGGIDSVLVWLGCAWAGAYEVPCNSEYRGPMLSYLIRDATARVVVVGERYLERIAEVAPELDQLETVIVVGSGETWRPELPFTLLSAAELLAGHGPEERPAPELWDIANVVYTSGTPGPSKGVLMPWGQMLASICSTPIGDDDEVWYSPFPMFHMTGKSSLYRPALAGGRAVLRERFSANELWDDIARFGCRSMYMVGTMQGFVHRRPERPDDADTPLRKVVMAPVIPQYREFERRFGVRVTTVFNMSELSTPIAAGWDLPDHLTCGRVRSGYEVRIVDEHDIEVEPGELGELIVRADQPWTLNAGYFRNPEATARAWRNGWFHTGDGFKRDGDGYYYFVDRLNDAIRRRGENISSTEVELLVASHPDVAECAAIGVPSPLGEDDVKVVVVAREGTAIDPPELIAFLEGRVPRFMLPRYVELADGLPKTLTNKVQKAALREAGVGERTWDRERHRLTRAAGERR